MKKSIWTILFSTVFLFTAYSQSGEVEQIVQKGIELYDEGDYKGAVEQYKKALKIDKESPLANYEIAMAYYALKDYENAVKYSDNVINAKADLMEQAYIINGSALDLQGKSKEAIKVYTKAIKAFPKSHLLCYNLALTHYKLKDYKKTESAIQDALKINPGHSSSHLLLAYLMSDQGSRVKTLLALYNFLLVEPTGNRAESAFELLTDELQKGVKKGDDNSISITLTDNGESDEFQAAELMLSLLAASDGLEENEGKTEYELFTSNNESFFAVLGELKKDSKGFWWEFYVDFFYAMKNEGHVEAFSYYISLSKGDENIDKWLESNSEKLDAFSNWYSEYKRKF